MNKILHCYNKAKDTFFQFRLEDTNFFSVFRISIGLLCLFHFLSYLRDFETLYISKDIVPQDAMRIQKPWFIPNIHVIINYLSDISSLPVKTFLTIFIGLYILLCISLAIGFRSRLSAIGLAVLHLIIVKGSHVFSYGVDYFTTISLFYCIIFPLGYGKGIDHMTIYKNKPIPNPSPYRRILQIHLCIIYFAGGLEKLLGENWRNGESFWKSIHLPGFTSLVKIDYSFIASFPLIAILAGWFVVLLELLYPMYIWKFPYRNYGLTLICLLHVGILLSLGLYFFSALMIILNLTAFLNLSPSQDKK